MKSLTNNDRVNNWVWQGNNKTRQISYLFIIQTSYHLDFEEFDTHVLYLLH